MYNLDKEETAAALAAVRAVLEDASTQAWCTPREGHPLVRAEEKLARNLSEFNFSERC